MQYDLSKISTLPPQEVEKAIVKDATKELRKRIRDLQNKMYADGQRSLLVVLQGMDASGKSSTVRRVFKEVHPSGIKIKAFKTPSKIEMAHDFLWRVHTHAPAKGYIQVFDRSHYEEVLITRVEGWIDDKTAQERFKIIENFEAMLRHGGTKILKFYLHISPEHQRESFYERITEPHKGYKFSMGDLEKAKKWDQYIKYYEDMMNNTSHDTPWIVVPADKSWYRAYIVARKVAEALESFNLSYPAPEVALDHPDVQALLKEFA